ncbi:MAG: hypothetical protein EBR09_05970 [Proteobacteria bacterium]|nr:hypothetical protein [Pseudomonadota bacterium]
MTEITSDKTTQQSRRHKGWLVLGLIAVVSIFMSVLTSFTYRQTEVHLVETYSRFSELGKSSSAENCINSIIAWLPRCDGMKALCEGAVPRVMDSCLTGQNRAQECAALANRPADAHFGFKECAARSLSKSLNKVCGNSYKALDLHCRSIGYLPVSIEKYTR